MSYQNINQYVFRRLYLKPLNEVTDISLASDEKGYDEEVIFSPLLIAEDDGDRLPLKFDINNNDTIDCINCGDFDQDTIVSENYWNPLGIDLVNCSNTTEICDVGLTGIDNGLVKKFSGETIELFTGLYTSDSDKFSRYKFDRRFKMHPITGFTTTSNRIFNDDSYTYNLSINNDGDTVGNYIKFDGGFYQGFYKSFGYDYQVLPERFHLGWTSEFMLRYRWTGNTDVGLNERYPENKGMFFYYGARAENKFYHYANGSPATDSGYTRVTEGLNCLLTCGCSESGYTASTCHYVYQQSGVTSQNCNCGQCPCNCKLCVKTFRITGGCETTGTCTTGVTYTTGTSITEWCSTRGIFDDCSGSTYAQEERWVQVDAVFQRDTYLDDCDLLYKGGLGEIVNTVYTASSANNSVSLIEPPITQEMPYDPATVEVVNLSERWVGEKNDRLGSLKFYVNGKLFMVVEGFEEIIPRPLNTSRETQIGVAYNISLGGGTQGLHDNLTLSGCPETLTGMTYQQDPECLTTEILDETVYSGLTTHIKLEKYFAGNFIGDISAFRMYSEPLNAAQIRHNFNLLKDRYALLDPFCLKCDSDISPSLITPTPTRTPTMTPTQTQTPTITQSQTPTTTQTPTLTQTQTVTQSETSTPTATPTITPTKNRFEFVVCSGGTEQESCDCLSTTLIWGDYNLYDENTTFYDAPTGSVTTDMSGWFNYSGVTVELDSVGNTISPFSLCQILTPTITATNTPTPSQTESPNVTSSATPTETPTPTPTIQDTNFLLQEDYFMILQEDGFGILMEVASPTPTPTPTI